MSMLQDLSERSREVSEVLLLECRLRLIAEEVEGGQKGALGERAEKELLPVGGTRCNACQDGIERPEEQ